MNSSFLPTVSTARAGAPAPETSRLSDLLETVDSIIWGPWVLLWLLLGSGIFLTVRLRGLQIRKLGPALRFAFLQRDGGGESAAAEGDISHYQALTTALAATVGVGNVVGVATAIHLGGPGALLWMWVTALFGMASKYSEAFLAVRFRTTDARGQQSGGPQYYLQEAIPGRAGRFLSVFFACAAVLASFGIGCMTQSNAVAVQLTNSFGVPAWAVGVVLAAAVAPCSWEGSGRSAGSPRASCR